MTTALTHIYSGVLSFLLCLPGIGSLVMAALCRRECRRLSRIATESGLVVTSCGCEDGTIVITVDPPARD